MPHVPVLSPSCLAISRLLERKLPLRRMIFTFNIWATVTVRVDYSFIFMFFRNKQDSHLFSIYHYKWQTKSSSNSIHLWIYFYKTGQWNKGMLGLCCVSNEDPQIRAAWDAFIVLHQMFPNCFSFDNERLKYVSQFWEILENKMKWIKHVHLRLKTNERLKQPPCFFASVNKRQSNNTLL